MDEGVRMRLVSKGEPGLKGAPAGSLYVAVEIEPHQFFMREGTDIHVTVPISYSQAVLGGRVMVPDLGGEQEVTLPAGTQPGAVKMFRGRGARNLQGHGYGNLVITFQLHVPTSTTDKQKEILKEFGDGDALPSVTEFRMRRDRRY